MNQRELFFRHVAQTSDVPLMGVDVDVESANGAWLRDKQGKNYLDLISGISVSSIGHCHPAVVEAVQAQASKFMHLMVYGEFNQEPQVKYAELLCSFLPPSLNSVFFTTGGSEAVEGAMKLVKRATGRNEIICFKNAYHGSTQGALSLMGSEEFKQGYRPLLPGIKILEFNNPASLKEISHRTAAVFIEPVQGEAGVRKADTNFMLDLSAACKNHGSLLVFDEIQSGFGRCGTMFAFEQYEVVPDILLLAKAMGGGMPIGAFVADRALMQCLTNNPVLGHINTFGGNAVCVAAAGAALKVLTKEKLWQRAPEIESKVRSLLKHPLIKEIRMCGALGAIDFGNEALNMKIIKTCIENGIITDWFLFCSTAMRLAPPLIISDNDLEDALKKIHIFLENNLT